MYGYSLDQKNRRDLAQLAIVVGIAIFALLVWYFDRGITKGIVIFFLIIWGLPLLWAIITLSRRKEFVYLDFQRGLLLSDEGENPITRLCPLVIWSSGGSEYNSFARKQTYSARRYQVIAEGWQNYVLYETFFKSKAERKRDEWSRLIGCPNNPAKI